MKIPYKIYNTFFLLKLFFLKHENYNGIEICGNNEFIQQTIKTLKLLKINLLDEYNFIMEYIGIICLSKHSGTLAQLSPALCKIDEETAFYSMEWYASIFYRNAYYIKKFKEGLRYNKINNREDKNIDNDLLEVQKCILQKLNAPKKVLEYIDSLHFKNK